MPGARSIERRSIERIASRRGFALLEALVATTIVMIAVAALAQLFVVSTSTNAGARMTTTTTLLAAQKMEQLRALAWGFDDAGAPQSDTTTDTTSTPESAIGGKGLTASPPDTLLADTAGYVDYLDAGGAALGSSPAAAGVAVFIRRWSIDPLPTNPGNTLILQVVVARARARGAAGTRAVEAARLVSVRTRRVM